MARPKPRQAPVTHPAQPRTLRTTLDEIPRVDLPSASPARQATTPLRGVPAPRTTSDGVLPLPSLKPPAATPDAHPPLPRTRKKS